MRIVNKISRWIVIIVAMLSVMGYAMSVAVGSTIASGQGWVALGWFVAGAIALYFELKSSKETS